MPDRPDKDPGTALLRDMLARERRPLIASAVLLICWAVGEAAVPVVIGRTVDEAIDPSNAGRLVVWVAVLAVSFLVLSYGFRTGSRLGWFATTRQKHRLRGLITAATLDSASTGTGAGESPRMPGEISSLAGSDTDSATNVLQQVAIGGANLVGLLGCAVYLLWADAWVGLAVLLITPLSLAALRLLTPVLSRTSHRQQSGIAAAGASAADVLQGVEVLRGTGGEDRARSWYVVHSRRAADAGIAAAGAAGRLAAARVLLSGAVLLLAAGLGSWRVIDGGMSVGTLIGVLGVTAFLAGPLGTVVGVIEEYTRSVASARRIAEILGEADSGGAPPTDPSGRTTPPDTDRTLALHLADGITVTCAPGTFTALVSGDADVHRQLNDTLTSRSGAVLLDGEDIRTIDPQTLPSVLRIAPHEAHLFQGTVRENILGSTGNTDLPTELLHASGVDELVDLFTDGADHGVEGGGSNLSGGQQQRITLARSLAGGRLTRVLTDPTTAVDSVTEARIADGLRDLRSTGDQGTLVVVTTSPNLLAVADEVVLLRADAPPRTASHTSLLADDTYREVVTR